ncbi:MAG: inositol monophosphatase [Gemmataceae bacterium]|nr:inositol monophosphatase [Gemmataceae bacterium]
MSQLLEWKSAACEAARKAGDLILSMRKKFQVREKGRFDLVTDADTASQKLIREHLMALFPDHGFLGEEDGKGEQEPSPGSPPIWIVDPIDGTTNYVHDLPLYGVSIGLWHEGKMKVGVVFDPPRNEMFHAAMGHGAFLNDSPIHTSETAELGTALITTGFPYSAKGLEFLFDWWEHFSSRCQALRRIGSTALNMAWVACGRCDAFYAFDNHVWDIAGGLVLLQEAGGIITQVDGSAYSPFRKDSLAANPLLHAQLLQQFQGGPKGY